MSRVAPVLVVLAALASQAHAQEAVGGPDPVAPLLARLELTLRSGIPDRYLELLTPSADRRSALEFAQAVITPVLTRAVVRERDRVPLIGVLPGDGYSVLVDVLLESASRARVSTWRLDVRRRPSGADADWGIVFQDQLSTLAGLYRLTLNAKRQIAVKDLVITAEDLRLTVADGSLFVAETEDGPTAVVVLGRGDMTFSPAPAAERSQMRVIAGDESLQTPFDGAFLRVNPGEFGSHFSAREMSDRPVVDPRDFKRADEIFREDLPKSFSLELADLSSETWSLVPSSEDLIAEIRTRRFDDLTYANASSEIEDISLFDRRNRHNLSVYSSRAHLARFSRFYSEDQTADYIVRSYDLDVAFDPSRERLQGRARLAIQTTAPSLNSLTLKLADSLNVQAVVSPELGRLLCARIRDRSSLVVNLPATLVRGYRLNLEVLYSGRLAAQTLDREAIELQLRQEPGVEDFEIPIDQSFLFSNRSYWYPQAAVLNYAPAEIRITLDEPWVAIASGQLVSATLAPGPAPRGVRRREFTYSAAEPVRYLALVVGQLTDVKREKLSLARMEDPRRASAAGAPSEEVELRVATSRSERSWGRDTAKTAAAILKFYSSLIGDCPYPSLTVVGVEKKLPGGHSPAYVSVLAVQSPLSTLRWADDPGALPFPEFFIAHELAHQWWGQAVGWKNYHEQWISEGFAQYFAALYAQRVRGGATFDAIIRRMQAWALDESDKGPIFLGYRIGHAKGDTRLYRAVVYNKGAMVLHMLRRLVGDDAFFRGLRRFYTTWRFQKAGTDDFRRAMEQECGLDLRRFFEQWVLGETVPQVAFSWRTEERGGVVEVVTRLEQTGEVFDVPVTITLEYEDGSTFNKTVVLTEKTLETRIPATRRLRRVDVNRDRAAVGVFKAVAGGD